MKKEIAEQWVAALRSGDYVRGAGVLKLPAGGYCCLGVLCDLHSKVSEGRWKEPEADKQRVYYVTPKCHAGRALCAHYLPAGVLEWSGINNYNPHVQRQTLAEINDGLPDGEGFEVVAAFIEEHWEIL